MPRNSAPSLRQVYRDWVEEQLEEYKDAVPREDLLRLADEVVEELRITQKGQYQLTELLLCNAVDRKIFKLLELPGYRSWSSARRNSRPFFPIDGRLERKEDQQAPESIDQQVGALTR